jgi:hypothetical protein
MQAVYVLFGSCLISSHAPEGSQRRDILKCFGKCIFRKQISCTTHTLKFIAPINE